MKDDSNGSEKAISGASGLLLALLSIEIVLKNSLFALPCHSHGLFYLYKSQYPTLTFSRSSGLICSHNVSGNFGPFWAVFGDFAKVLMDGHTDMLRDRLSYRDARTHLKKNNFLNKQFVCFTK